MYRIVFSGQLLDGFATDAVRSAVAERLKLGTTQVERMFSGQAVVLKKAVSEEGSGPYIQELRRLGMDARLEPLAQHQVEERALATFKVVFWGKLLRGYDKTLVMRAVTRRLRVGPAQLVQMFGGGKVVLKRGVNAEVGARYVTELARIGMLVELEVETETLAQAAPIVAPPIHPTPAAPAIAAPTAEEAEPFTGLLRTQLDMSQAMRTALVQSDISGEAEPVEEGVVPDFVPKGIAAPAMAAHASMPARSTSNASSTTAPVNTMQVKCPQCGRHQLAGPRCRACGLELSRLPAAAQPKPAPRAQRMDASAYGAVTTLMQGLRNAVAPQPAAQGSGSGVPTWMFNLRQHMAEQQEAHSGLQRQHIVALVTGVAVLLMVWFVLFN